jgi:hypothetical protein
MQRQPVLLLAFPWLLPLVLLPFKLLPVPKIARVRPVGRLA